MAHVPLRVAWFRCGFCRGCSSRRKAGLWPVPRDNGPKPTTPRRHDCPLVASEEAPGPRRTPGHCLRAPISQRPGTTGHNENNALPFPRHDCAPQHGDAPAAFDLGHPMDALGGSLWTLKKGKWMPEGSGQERTKCRNGNGNGAPEESSRNGR